MDKQGKKGENRQKLKQNPKQDKPLLGQEFWAGKEGNVSPAVALENIVQNLKGVKNGIFRSTFKDLGF